MLSRSSCTSLRRLTMACRSSLIVLSCAATAASLLAVLRGADAARFGADGGRPGLRSFVFSDGFDRADALLLWSVMLLLAARPILPVVWPRAHVAALRRIAWLPRYAAICRITSQTFSRGVSNHLSAWFGQAST